MPTRDSRRFRALFRSRPIRSVDQIEDACEFNGSDCSRTTRRALFQNPFRVLCGRTSKTYFRLDSFSALSSREWNAARKRGDEMKSKRSRHRRRDAPARYTTSRARNSGRRGTTRIKMIALDFRRLFPQAIRSVRRSVGQVHSNAVTAVRRSRLGDLIK